MWFPNAIFLRALWWYWWRIGNSFDPLHLYLLQIWHTLSHLELDPQEESRCTKWCQMNMTQNPKCCWNLDISSSTTFHIFHTACSHLSFQRTDAMTWRGFRLHCENSSTFSQIEFTANATVVTMFCPITSCCYGCRTLESAVFSSHFLRV